MRITNKEPKMSRPSLESGAINCITHTHPHTHTPKKKKKKTEKKGPRRQQIKQRSKGLFEQECSIQQKGNSITVATVNEIISSHQSSKR